jgi:hypothetical protein
MPDGRHPGRNPANSQPGGRRPGVRLRDSARPRRLAAVPSRRQGLRRSRPGEASSGSGGMRDIPHPAVPGWRARSEGRSCRVGETFRRPGRPLGPHPRPPSRAPGRRIVVPFRPNEQWSHTPRPASAPGAFAAGSASRLTSLSRRAAQPRRSSCPRRSGLRGSGAVAPSVHGRPVGQLDRKPVIHVPAGEVQCRARRLEASRQAAVPGSRSRILCRARESVAVATCSRYLSGRRALGGAPSTPRPRPPSRNTPAAPTPPRPSACSPRPWPSANQVTSPPSG